MELNRNELRWVLVMGTLVGLVVFGIGLIIPIFSVYAINYEGATVVSVGVAFGIYSLAQGLLEIPFGMASDRFGRKPVIVAGLAIFCIGSLLCAFADSIWELVLTRALQGSGAIGAVATASLGDSTRPEVRAQSFMLAGIIIALAFLISAITGPLLAAKLGFGNLFFLLAAVGAVACCLAVFLFPELPRRGPRDRREILLKLREAEVRKIFFSAFIVSLAIHLFFFVYPLSWKNVGTEPAQLWFVYLVVLVPSLLADQFYIRLSERRKKLRQATLVGLFFLIAAFAVYLLLGTDRFALYVSGIAFFVGFGVFQSLLPAFFTQRVSSENRGALTGFFNLSNLMGACVGAMSAGVLYRTHESLPLIFVLCLLVLWRLIGFPRPPDPHAD